MRDPRYLWDHGTVHRLFEASLWLKGAFALAEIIAGIGAYFVSQQLLLSAVVWVTQEEFVLDPNDVIADYFLHTIQNLSIGTQKFAALYLLAHGIAKLWLVIGLLREKLWYYPVAMIVFALFIAYQCYRYTLTHSVWLLLITVLDLIVVELTWHEYRHLRDDVRRLIKAPP
jgi:uncharacterized membrane protein